jgi:hypothetical protein
VCKGKRRFVCWEQRRAKKPPVNWLHKRLDWWRWGRVEVHEWAFSVPLLMCLDVVLKPNELDIFVQSCLMVVIRM